MRKQLALLVTLAAVLTLPAASLAGPAEAQANLHQINGSKVRAKFVFLDTGSQVVITGVASGLDPAQSYISLAYDQISVPAGPDACRPTSSAPGFIAPWTVNQDGSGTLTGALPTGSLDGVGTVSVRIAATMALQACGRVSQD